MRLNHLHLHVTDVEASRDFYCRFFGLSEHVEHGRIVFLRDGPDGMDLALAPADVVEPMPDWFHFGFRLGSSAAVRALHARAAEGLTITQPLEEADDFVFFRCRDPSGYQIEVYWE